MTSTWEDVEAYFDLAIETLGEGGATLVHTAAAMNWRLGQTFFNFLSDQDQERLRGTIHDPFYKDDQQSVCEALDFLLEPS